MITTYNKSGFLHSYHDQTSLVDIEGNKFWHINGKLEKDGGLPCIELINGDKRYSLENDGYKIIEKYKNQIHEKYYNLNNELHRLDGPAEICYYENGNVKSEYYYIDGTQHKTRWSCLYKLP